MQKSLYILVTLLVIAFTKVSFAQENSGADSLKNISLAGLSFRSIGPAVTGGRVVDIAVNPFNYSEYYLLCIVANETDLRSNVTAFNQNPEVVE